MASHLSKNSERKVLSVWVLPAADCIAFNDRSFFTYQCCHWKAVMLSVSCLDIPAAVHRSLRAQFLHHRQVSQKRQRRLPLDWRGRSYSLSNQVCWWSKYSRVSLIQTWKDRTLHEICVLGGKAYSNCHNKNKVTLRVMIDWYLPILPDQLSLHAKNSQGVKDNRTLL